MFCESFLQYFQPYIQSGSNQRCKFRVEIQLDFYISGIDDIAQITIKINAWNDCHYESKNINPLKVLLLFFC